MNNQITGFRSERFSGEYLAAIGFLSIYLIIAIFFGGLGFETDTVSHVTLIQETAGVGAALPYFGREYVWLPGFHYLEP